jgi:hypothetical protein
MAAADVAAIMAGRPRPMPKPAGAAATADPAAAAPAAPATDNPAHAAAIAAARAAAAAAKGGAPRGAAPAAAVAAPATPAAPPAFPTSGPGWMCLYLCCEGAPPEFDAAARLSGPGGSYLAHIKTAIGIDARLAGRGSGSHPEGPAPLHLRLASADAARLEEGRK